MPKTGLRFIFQSISNVFFCLSCCIFITTAAYAATNVEGIQVYQKNVHLSPENKRKLAADIRRYHNADNLWEVLREEFSLPHYENNPYVQDQINWLMNNQTFLMNSAIRAAPYLYYVLQQVRKHHLPAELALIPLIESGYNPFAYSPAGASGLWQMMPSTASGYGVKQNWWYDGRRDVIASTRAALMHLAYLQNYFEGNWLLAIAAYNTGEGSVQASIKRNARAGYATEFWSLSLPQETRDYVPRLLALAIIISHPDQYPVNFPNVPNAPYLAQVDVGRQINLKIAATFAGLHPKKLAQLNPAFKNALENPTGPRKLMLPIENVERFTINLARSPLHTPLEWMKYKIKYRDTLPVIAKRFNTTTSALRKLNHLSSNQPKRGTYILIPRTKMLAEEPSLAAEPRIKLAAKKIKKSFTALIHAPQYKGKYSLQPGDTVYMVRAQDTLFNIANRFHTSVQRLQQANGLKNNSITPGKQLIIPTHLATAKPLAGAGTARLSPGDTVYMVRPGDTMEKIAAKFKTTAAAIRVANLMQHNQLEEGESIIIPTHIG